MSDHTETGGKFTKCRESPRSTSVPTLFDHALGYAKSRVRYGSGEIRVLNAAGEVTQTIPFNEKAG